MDSQEIGVIHVIQGIVKIRQPKILTPVVLVYVLAIGMVLIVILVP